MIDRDKVLEFIREDAYRPMAAEDLLEGLSEPLEKLSTLLALLDEMEARGDIVKTRANRYATPERLDLVVGKISANPRGFAFVLPDFPGLTDLHIQADKKNGAMHGDRVVARRIAGELTEGEIIRILHRAHSQVVGTVGEMVGSLVFVRPDDLKLGQDILIQQDNVLMVEPRDKVVVEITRYPDGRRGPEGRIIEKLGKAGEPGVDVEAIIRKFHLREDFPEEVMAEVAKIPLEVQQSDLEGRRDLRDWTLVTIDGEDAKDLDDAVSVMETEDGFELGVHIADVSYYVQPGTALDKEARQRATSTYLVDRVIPMLPTKLSNGICSLNPKVNRLTVSCLMRFDRQGQRLSYEIFPSVIKTAERMTYTAVNQILEGDPKVRAKYEPLVPLFERMQGLMSLLRHRRQVRGSIDFDLADVKVILDEVGRPIDMKRRVRTTADQVVEEFMLAANEAVAEFYARRNLPFLYRVHEEPVHEKLESLNLFLAQFGYALPSLRQRIRPRVLQSLLQRVQDKPEEQLISQVVLRSMQRARYLPENLGHFGLAAEYYTHFTSPIRRYPDLMIHRIMRLVGWDATREGKLTGYRSMLPDVALQSSEQERAAEEAERESVAMKKVEFMEDKLGQTFDGLISGVTNFGFFVELENTVEGLVRLGSLTDDYYHFYPDLFTLVGERTNRQFRLGDAVRVRVERVDKEQRQIDFSLLQPKRPTKSKREPFDKKQDRRYDKKSRKKRRSGEKAKLSGGRG